MTTTPQAPTPIRITRPADVVGAVPLLLGFHPSDSFVAVVVAPRGTFCARVDVPTDPADLPEVIDALAGPITRHGATLVLLLAYPLPGTAHTPGMFADLALGLTAAGVPVRSCIEVHHDHLIVDGTRTTRPAELAGVTAARVERGYAPLPSRESLREALAPLPGAATAAEVATARAMTPADVDVAIMWAWADLPGALERPEVPAFLAGLEHGPSRDAICARLTRENAEDMRAGLVNRVLRHTAPEARTHIAPLVALAAWLSGNGAAAWAALDTAPAPTVLSTLVTTLLERAVPPEAWSAMTPGATTATD